MLYGRPTVGNEPRKLIAIRLDARTSVRVSEGFDLNDLNGLNHLNTQCRLVASQRNIGQ